MNAVSNLTLCYTVAYIAFYTTVLLQTSQKCSKRMCVERYVVLFGIFCCGGIFVLLILKYWSHLILNGLKCYFLLLN